MTKEAQVRDGPESWTEEAQVKAQSSLNLISIICSDTEPLVRSWWNRADTTDLSDPQSLKHLAKGCLEMIDAVSEQILNTLTTYVLAGSERERPLLLLEEDVSRALLQTLKESFTAALSTHTHPSMDQLLTLLTDEVTNNVNSALGTSTVQDRGLLVSQDRTYRTPKDKLKAMVRHIKKMLRSVKEKTDCCFIPQHTISQTRGQDQTGTSKQCSVKEHLRKICVPCGPRVQDAEEEVLASSETPSSRTQEKHALNARKTVSERFSSPTGQRESNSLLESNQDQVNDDQTFLPGQDIFLVRSPSTLQKDVQEILEKAAQELSGDSSSLIHDSKKSAASIVRTISEESVDPTPVPGHSGTKLPWLHKVTQELKSFFLMCFSKAAICRCLRRLYCLCGHSPPSSSEVQNLTNEALRFLMQEPSNQDVYESTISGLNDAMAMGDGLSEESWSSWELSESLTRSLQPWMQNLVLRRAAHEQVRSLICDIYNWLQRQFHTLAIDNPVLRALRKIRKLVIRTHSQPTVSTEEESLSSVNVEPAESSGSEDFDSSAAVDMRLSTQWNEDDCNGLVCEVVKRIFQNKDPPERITLAQCLFDELNAEIQNWDVQVQPCRQNFKNTAKCVYKDLIHGIEKDYVTQAVCIVPGYIDTILNSIHQHLTEPQQKRSKLRALCIVPGYIGTILNSIHKHLTEPQKKKSLWRAFCCWR
uniref:Uncharacterized protein n=1 Tax=Knipowitschia caucasica TaxID=637954 RepID=A0AAV2LU88_KNICA